MAGLTKEQQRKKMEAELAVAIAAKPPSLNQKPQAVYNPDYVAPPVVNLQAQLEAQRFKRTEEEQAKVVIVSNQDTVEILKATIAEDTHKGPSGASAEAEEAARAETVRQIKVQLAKEPNKPDLEAARSRDQRAHLDSLDLIKAEMANSIHNDPYTG